MNAAWGFIGTIVGAVVATVGTLWATHLQQSHASKREREAGEREADERRRVFQRETLLELQEALAALVRLHGRLHHHNEMEWRQSGEWGRSLVPEDVNVGVLTQGVRVVMLAERISDDGVREALRTFTDALAGLTVLRDRDSAHATLYDLTNDYATLQRHVGAVFRAL